MLRKRIIFTVFLLGLLFPFVPFLVILEAFLLWLPIGAFFLAALSWSLVCLVKKNSDWKKALFLAALVPLFMVSQLMSAEFVTFVQRYRSEKAIAQIEKLNLSTGRYPASYDIGIGITYQHHLKKNQYTIRYSGGFLVSEYYDSQIKKWERLGWND
ncbi:MAG TPA: hypothetical protein VK183_06310 [Flavobacterium sp.]|nr:hypothetical protein [Flavobacterium sp.]